MNFLFANRMNDFWENEIRKLRMEFPDQSFAILSSGEESKNQIKKADGIVIGNLPLETLSDAITLKILFIPWTGLDRLPFNLLRKLNCMVANTHGNADAVAERALGLCLSLLGRIAEYDHDLRKGIWHGYSVNSPEKDKWVSLRKKTVGIIGCGVIGQKLVELLSPFRCKMIGLKKHLSPNVNEEGVKYTISLEEVIEKSEILFLFLPLTKDTRSMINKDVLRKMKGKYLINLGRGKLIEESDLYESLQNDLKGFASDVWYQYPKERNLIVSPSQYPFHLLPNVVLSPHVGGFNGEGQNEMIRETIENLRSFIQKGKPVYEANLQDEY
jgi:phosphoglycerate dehydrogenase-like enzyme